MLSGFAVLEKWIFENFLDSYYNFVYRADSYSRSNEELKIRALRFPSDSVGVNLFEIDENNF